MYGASLCHMCPFSPTAEQERQAQRVQFVREDSCHLFTSCKSCLSLNEDNEEYKVVCAWSEMLQEVSPTVMKVVVFGSYLPEASNGKLFSVKKTNTSWVHISSALTREGTKTFGRRANEY